MTVQMTRLGSYTHRMTVMSSNINKVEFMDMLTLAGAGLIINKTKYSVKASPYQRGKKEVETEIGASSSRLRYLQYLIYEGATR